MVNLPYCLQILEIYLFNMIAIEILNEISEEARRQAIFLSGQSDFNKIHILQAFSSLNM